jgi:hypothetical protein
MSLLGSLLIHLEWDHSDTERKLFEAYYKSVEARNFNGTAYEYAKSKIEERRKMNDKRNWELYP